MSALAGSGFPVDAADIISRNIFLDLLKLKTVADLADLPATGVCQVIAHGAQLELTKGEERRHHFDHGCIASFLVTADDHAQHALHKYVDIMERIFTALQGPQIVMQGGVFRLYQAWLSSENPRAGTEQAVLRSVSGKQENHIYC